MALKVAAWLAVVIMFVLSSAPPAEAAVSCGQVIQSLTPCLGYVQGRGATAVPAPCCNGVRSLNSVAKTAPDRKSVCTCLKNLATNIPTGFPFDVIARVPAKCGVRLPYQISTDIDCAKIK